ncbi:MAG: hypothetical protein HY080_10515 [Gammaproteobacteria bacterium]|nr:hypothetical protein [Gammaproteobacteria bacterium]
MRGLITLLVLFSSTLTLADSGTIQVKGEHEFKLSRTQDRWEISAADKTELHKASVVKTADSLQLKDKAGTLLGSCQTLGKESMQQRDAGGNIIYQFDLTAKDTYLVADKDKKKLWRVKIKEDKFNLYDAHDTRLRHGKPKGDAISVRSENDQQLLKIQGVNELRRASYLALPVDGKWQILAFLCAP